MRDPAALDRQAIDWLRASKEPGIHYQARRELLDEEAADDAAAVLEGPLVRALLANQQPDGGFGNHPYQKWLGAHWRLVSLVELGVPPGQPRALAAYETVLRWLLGDAHRRNVPVIEGRARRCASQEGNALAVGVRLGLAGDPRVERLARSLAGWQWPDGGWNCDRRALASHSSFNETVTPLWGLAEYARVTGDAAARASARRTCELLLDHQVYLSHRTDKAGNVKWQDARYPPYWRYDIHQGLLMLARAGALPDQRADRALDLLRERQADDGRWHLAGQPMWSTGPRAQRDAVDWGRSGPSEMLTLNALRILRAADRLALT
ncbi:MAG TPA: hypothetical protein VNT28_00715 [Candidatus Limnocylindrales bacterium]|nr:hypothetical protein [Candidatus Limnocylindrales bacterium]